MDWMSSSECYGYGSYRSDECKLIWKRFGHPDSEENFMNLLHNHHIKGYRGMTRYFDETKLPYHRYALAEEKPLKVILRDVPVEITESDVKSDLVQRGFEVLSVTRFRLGAGKTPIPLVMVKLKNTANSKTIFDARHALRVRITVESPHKRTAVGQCYRCQQFGHAQRLCRAAPKCVMCGDCHSSAACTEARTEPDKSANCAGEHPARYRGCPARHATAAGRCKLRVWHAGINTAATVTAANLSVSNAAPTKGATARLTAANLADGNAVPRKGASAVKDPDSPRTAMPTPFGRVNWRKLVPVVLGIMEDLNGAFSSCDVIAVIFSHDQAIAVVLATTN